MCCFQTTFKIGECFHKFSRTFSRDGINCMARAQVADETREKALGRAHHLEREVCKIVTKTTYETAYLVAQKRTEIDILKNKFNALDIPIKTRTRCRKQTYAPTRLVRGQHHKTAQKCNRGKDGDEVRHGS